MHATPLDPRGRSVEDAEPADASELRVVVEELRVADEEIAVQQSQIEVLLDQDRGARRSWSALVSALPVAVLATTLDGAVSEANPAASSLLGVPLARLMDKPLQAYVSAGGRQGARTLVSDAVRTGRAAGSIPLSPRGGAPVLVDAVVTSTDGGQLRWVLATPANGLALAPAQQSGPDDGLRAVAQLCELPVGSQDVQTLLRSVATLATRAVPGAGWASLTLGDPADPSRSASDSEVAQRADGAQWQSSQGPCRQAWLDGVAVSTVDVQEDERWPLLAPRLAGSPVRSALGVPVLVAGDLAGVLNLYAPLAGALVGEGVRDRAVVFAAAAGAILADDRRMQALRETAAGLEEAMRSRATIEQAKGLVAGWLDCDVEEAFAVLSTMSQDRNVKLRDVAAVVVADRAGREQVRSLVHATQARRGAARRGARP